MMEHEANMARGKKGLCIKWSGRVEAINTP